MIKIKDFSEITGFSIRMLRYLEEVGVLVPRREENNYRIYSEGQVDEAKKIKKLQVLGVQLKEVQMLQTDEKDLQIKTLENVLKREVEISEMKSDSIPELKNILDCLRNGEGDLDLYLENEKTNPRKMRTLGGDEKFHRTAYSMPILRSIYEDHLTIDANIELIATDLMKFSEWFKECDYLADVFSVLRESSFVFGNIINERFINGFEKAWKKFLPDMGFQRLEDFTREDVSQLMGPHDIVIRTTFKYIDSGIEGEIVIPYSPIYTMSQLSNKT
ncbi:MAG: MerR family transcriptional regulator [Halobacteriovoraceae bacterium]|nr:MerR family transcriptional regulator [Halobacteriovoraceae bacterium]